jgi:hypothetical protein
VEIRKIEVFRVLVESLVNHVDNVLVYIDIYVFDVRKTKNNLKFHLLKEKETIYTVIKFLPRELKLNSVDLVRERTVLSERMLRWKYSALSDERTGP